MGNMSQLPALLTDKAREYAQQSHATNTRRAYTSDWNDFTAWCSESDRSPLPATPETVALYITDRAEDLKTATLQRRLVTIVQAHRTAGLASPTEDAGVRHVWRGIRRAKGTAQTRKAPVLAEQLKAAVQGLGKSVGATRDRALLLVGFAMAARRSELVALDVEDLQFTGDGLVVTIRRSKTDQEGQGRQVGVPFGSSEATCPVRALKRWLQIAGITSGPVFRSVTRGGRVSGARLSDRAVALVVKAAAAGLGLDAKEFAGHSLRAGMITSAVLAGCSDSVVMQQSGHRSHVEFQGYVRTAKLWQTNPVAGLL